MFVYRQLTKLAFFIYKVNQFSTQKVLILRYATNHKYYFNDSSYKF